MPAQFSIVVTSSTDSTSISAAANLAKDGTEISAISVAATRLDNKTIEDFKGDLAKESATVSPAMAAKDARKAWSKIAKVFGKAVEDSDKNLFKD